MATKKTKYYGEWVIAKETPSEDGNTITLEFAPESMNGQESMQLPPATFPIERYNTLVSDKPMDIGDHQRKRLTPVVADILQLLVDHDVYYESGNDVVFNDIPFVFRLVAETIDGYRRLVEDHHYGTPRWQRTLKSLNTTVKDIAKE